MRVDEAACNQQQETVVRLVTENKVSIIVNFTSSQSETIYMVLHPKSQGLRELLEISQRSLSTPVQRTKRPAPSIHKEVSCESENCYSNGVSRFKQKMLVKRWRW